MSLDCRTDARRGRVRAAHLTGIDEVETDDAGTRLTVTFLGHAPKHLKPHNIRIDGGRRITGLHAVAVELEAADDPELDDRLHVTIDRPGDTSAYTLGIVEADPFGRPGTEPYHGFDPRYAHASFSFRPDCPTGFDCVPAPPDPPEPTRRRRSTTWPATTTACAGCCWTG